MARKILQNTTYDAVTIDSAKQTAAVYLPDVQRLVYFVIASSSSSPTGTTLQIQGSMNGTNFVNLDSTVSVTGDGSFAISLADVSNGYLYYRLSYARSSGSYVATTTVVGKGDAI